MLSPNLIESNKKLDVQINKLRECKADMIKMFHDLDNLIDSSPHSSFCCRSQSSLSKSNLNLYEISSSDSDFLNSDSESDSEFYQYSGGYIEPSRRPSLKFSFRFPIDTEYDNISTFSSYTPGHGEKYNYDQYTRMPSSRHTTKRTKKEPPKSKSSLYRPKSQTSMNNSPWRPVGRVMSKSAIFSSTQDLSKHKVKAEKDPKDIGNGWKPTLGKSKEDLRIYSNSSYEKSPFRSVTVKKKIVSDPKDIGQGWKNILAKPKNNLQVYASNEVEREPFKTVVVKRKVVRDPKDIGKGARPKPAKSFHSSDYQKEPFKSVIVKRKSFKDEKDVGNGWKPVCTKSKDDLKQLYERPAIPIAEKNIPNSNKDSSKAWKPNGKIKPDNPYKSDFTKPSEMETNIKKNTKDEKIVSKDWKPNGKVKPDNPYKADFIRPSQMETNNKKNPKDAKIVGKEWKPNGKVKPDNPYKKNEDKNPVTNKIKSGASKGPRKDSRPPIPKKNPQEMASDEPKPTLNLENVADTNQDEDIYKTSTPNVSKKIEENELQESVIKMGDNELEVNQEELENELNFESEGSNLEKPIVVDENVEIEEKKTSEEIEANVEKQNEDKKENVTKNDDQDGEIIKSNQSKNKDGENDIGNEQVQLEDNLEKEEGNIENGQLEMSKKSQEIKQSELISKDEDNEASDNNLDNKENDQVSKLNESLKIIEDNDNDKKEDDENNDQENENQLWKFEDSDEE